MNEPIKDYIGDGVYVEFDGNSIKLSTTRYDDTYITASHHYIYLEPEQMLNLKNFEIRVIAAMQEQKDQQDQQKLNFEQGGSDNARSK